MIDHIDTTPIVNPVVMWESIALFDPKRQALESVVTQTRFTQSKNDPYELFASATGALAPTAVPNARHTAERSSVVNDLAVTNSDAPKEEQEAEIDRIANQRVKLMAVKYASSATSAEVLARLEILNQRLLDRAPRVSMEQVEALENANEKLARIRAAREARAIRLGMSV